MIGNMSVDGFSLTGPCEKLKKLWEGLFIEENKKEEMKSHFQLSNSSRRILPLDSPTCY